MLLRWGRFAELGEEAFLDNAHPKDQGVDGNLTLRWILTKEVARIDGR
jgi:hypothetical protein